MKNELQNIISGKSKVKYGNAIQTVARYLRRCKKQALWLKKASTSKTKKTHA